MKFGSIPTDTAEGAILAHTQRLADRVIRKGTCLDAGAVAALRAAGIDRITAATLEPGDVGENDAAFRLGEALASPGLARSRAATGRVNLVAERAGLLRVDVPALDRINSIDEALTVATLPDLTPVQPRDMIATIKIIPFGVAAARLEAVAEAVAGVAPVTLFPFRPMIAGLVLTALPGLKESVTEGTIKATQARIAGLGGTLLPPLRCAHAEAPITAALRDLLAQGAELLLVAGASAVVDRRDVGPAGIVGAGGEILHFGMPVDPGNLICLGQVGTVPALVLPGCARSPRPNGIDWVLQRLFAGLPVGGAEIMRMGAGGLLKESDSRPLPRAAAVAADAPKRSGVAVVVLAAGRSSRMAPHNKLLVEDRAGRPMIARVVDNALSSGARPVLVVTGHAQDAVRQALANRPVTLVDAPDYADGLSASLRAGVAAVPAETQAAMICLGDMPLVTGRMLDRLIAAHDPDEGRLIVVPTFKGKPGNPILWNRRYFAEMQALTGDTGARFLLQRHMEQMVEVEIDDDAVLRDFDTVESLATLPPRMRPA